MSERNGLYEYVAPESVPQLMRGMTDAFGYLVLRERGVVREDFARAAQYEQHREWVIGVVEMIPLDADFAETFADVPTIRDLDIHFRDYLGKMRAPGE